MRLTVRQQQHLDEQTQELKNLGYDAQVDGDSIAVRLTVQQAIFIQAATICSKSTWSEKEVDGEG